MNRESLHTHIGEVQTELGTPTRESAQKLYDEFDHASAVNAYVWGMPAVNQAGYIFAWRDFFKAQWGQFVALPTLQDRRGTLTPTTTSTYVLAVANLAETGPLVLEDLPGNNVGIISDLWQRLIAQNGFAGPFQGRGGRFLILGPGQEPPEDVSGYHVVRSLTNHIFFGTRLLDDDKEKAIREQAPLLQAYPHSQREAPPKKPLILANSRTWSQNPPSGLAYFERLAAILQDEPTEERDRFLMAQLKALGIEKTRPFQPDERQKRILTEAARVGELTVESFTAYRRGGAPMWPGKQWKSLFTYPPSQREEHYDHFEERALLYWEIFGIGIQSKGPGTGSFYAVSYWDKNANLLDGGADYRLHIPADVPVKTFWSVCAYDAETRTFFSGTERVMVGSQEPGYEINPDGTTDVFFGPAAPEGKEKNWVQTIPGKSWFSYFRFFGPTEPFFDKSWVLSDIEKMD